MRVSHRQTAAGAKGAARRLPFLLLSGLALVGAMPAPSLAQTSIIERPAAGSPYTQAVAEAAQRFGIPERWIWAVMRIESGGRVRAVSPKGAMGLMQIMPATWADLRARHGLGADPFDPRDNILAGAAYLREMHDRYGAPGFLAAYNAGPGRYEDYRDRHRQLPAETVAYVAALVPFVGDDAIDGPVLVAASDPSSWTQAPLFITRSASAEPAERTTSKKPSNDHPAAVAVRDVSAIAPQSAGLFVSVSAAGPKP